MNPAGWRAVMRVCESDLQIVVLDLEGDLLKAKLPLRSEHPRALVTVQRQIDDVRGRGIRIGFKQNSEYAKSASGKGADEGAVFGLGDSERQWMRVLHSLRFQCAIRPVICVSAV